MIITLTGFMGCGKTSTGRALGALLSWDVTDLDAAIENRIGKTVAEIFAQEGESGFRTLEKEVLAEVLSRKDDNLVLSLGGGTINDKDNLNLVKRSSRCIYLRAAASSLAEWLSEDMAEKSRPLLNRDAGVSLESHIASMLEEREPYYLAAADEIVDVDGLDYDETALRIREILSI